VDDPGSSTVSAGGLSTHIAVIMLLACWVEGNDPAVSLAGQHTPTQFSCSPYLLVYSVYDTYDLVEP